MSSQEDAAPLPRASSEPDIVALVSEFEHAPQLDLDTMTSIFDPAHAALSGRPPPPLTLSLTPLTLPEAEPAPGLAPAPSTFTEYVATELARSAIPGGMPAPIAPGATPGDVMSRFLGPDEAGIVRAPAATQPQRSPLIPRLPRLPRSPHVSDNATGGASPPPPNGKTGGKGAKGTKGGKGDAGGEPHYAHLARQNKLSCVEIDAEGVARPRLFSRSEILEESRSTLHKSHPSPSSAALWMRQLDGAPPNRDVESDRIDSQMTSFAVLMDGTGPPGSAESGDSKDTLREYLRKYLRNSLQPRDIRQVDPAFAAKPALWIRNTALVISMEGLRAIVFRNKLLLFDAENPKTLAAAAIAQQIIVQRPEGGAPPLPFEFRALEAILIHVLFVLEGEFTSLKPAIHKILGDLPEKLSTKTLEALRLHKQRLNQFHSRATIVQDIIEKVLDEDEDMANMYLTEKHTHPKRARNVMEHDEVEMLLEAYLQGIDELVNNSSLLSGSIEDTEDLVMIHLDSLRNRLLSVELAMSVVSMTFGFGSMIGGVFGMNLPIPLFDEGASSFWFLGVVLFILAFVVFVSYLVLRALRIRGLYSNE